MNEPMTDTERIAMTGIAAREREVMAPIHRDLAALCRAVEARLGLEPGALGTTHVMDTDSWTVREVSTQVEVADGSTAKGGA